MALVLLGCREEGAAGPSSVSDFRKASGTFLERGGPGRLRYLGFSSPNEAQAGQAITLEHHLLVEHRFASDAQIFVHGDGAGGVRWALSDHHPNGTRLSALRSGTELVDRHSVVISAQAEGTLQLFFGLFDREGRMTLEAPMGRNDGRDRLVLSSVQVRSKTLPRTIVRRRTSPIAVDGKLDEPAWNDAEVLSLSDSMGRTGSPRFPTKLRILYDEANLYVGFEAEDIDISERYQKRDDPIYEHEAVELFLMPGVKAPQTGPYVELQASPTGVLFDASFSGPRQNMNRAYNATQTVGTQRIGSLNDPSDRDQRWVSEWKVPYNGIRGVSKPPQVGEEWRMNAFRIEKYRDGAKQHSEYTAWSPPQVGDFHAVHKFGRMVFGE